MAKYKSATVTAEILEVKFINTITDEIGKKTVTLDSDMSDKEKSSYIASQIPADCMEFKRISVGKKEITYRIPWEKFMEYAEVWKIDGQTVNKSEGE